MANRTSGDASALVALGDSVATDLGSISGAHFCYLLAGNGLEAARSTARLVLIGADHKNMRDRYLHNVLALQVRWRCQ